MPDREEFLAVVLEAWREVLGVDVRADDNFFDLGGHSLLLLYTIEIMDERAGATISIEQFFEGPTPRQIAETLTSNANGDQV